MVDNIFARAKTQSEVTDQAIEEAVQTGQIIDIQSQETFSQSQVTTEQFMEQYREAQKKENDIRNIPDIILSVAKFINPDFDKQALKNKKEQAIFEINANSKRTVEKLQALDLQRKSAAETANLETAKLTNLLKIGQAEQLEKEAARTALADKIEATGTAELRKLAADKNNPELGLIEQELTSRQTAALQLRQINNNIKAGDLELAEKAKKDFLLSQSPAKFEMLAAEVERNGTAEGFTILDIGQARALRNEASALQGAAVTENTLADAKIKLALEKSNAIMGALANNNQPIADLVATQKALEDLTPETPAAQRVAMVAEVEKIQQKKLVQFGQTLGLNPEESTLLSDEVINGKSYPSPILAKAITDANASSIIGSGKFAPLFLPTEEGSKENIISLGGEKPPVFIDNKTADVNVIQKAGAMVTTEITRNGYIHFADQNELLQSVGGGVALSKVRGFDDGPTDAFINHIRQVAKAKGFTDEQARAVAQEAVAFIEENVDIIATQARDSTSMADKALLSRMFGTGDPYANSASSIGKTINSAVDKTWQGPGVFESIGNTLKTVGNNPLVTGP